MKSSFFRRLIAWARGEQTDEQRRARIDEELKKPLVFGYADRPRADDLKALGLKESDFNSQARSQKGKIK